MDNKTGINGKMNDMEMKFFFISAIAILLSVKIGNMAKTYKRDKRLSSLAIDLVMLLTMISISIFAYTNLD